MTAAWRPGRNAVTWTLLALLALSCVYFAARGPYRAWSDLDDRDLTSLYVATRAWLDGTDPYDDEVLSDLAADEGIRLGARWSLHPPTTFVLLTPLAALPWPVAEKVSVISNVLLQLACIAMAMSLADLRLRQARGLLFVAFAMALAPFHTAISEGQSTIAVAALVVAALLAEEHERPVAGGVCIALAAALKPQMGLIFILLLLLRGQWKALGSAGVTLGAIAGIGVSRLALASVDWVPTLLSNLAGSGVSDATLATTQRLNMQALLNVLLPGQGAAAIDLITYGVGAAAVTILFVGLRHRTDREARLLLYAGCGTITLLMVYNRSYGATLLILALAWAFALCRPRSLQPVAVVVALATAVFLVPGAAALAHVGPPDGLAWVMPWWPFLQVHQVFALIVILVALLVAARRPAGRPALVAARDAPTQAG